MKVPPARAEAFLAAIDDDCHGVLLYGPDAGLVRERARALASTVAGNADDPFLMAELTAVETRDDPARLTDEVAALAFGGGRRVVRLRGAGDGASKAVEGALEALNQGDGPPPSLLIVEAGELGPRSSLRRLFEGAEQGAAVPCYLDDGAGLERVIEEALRQRGLRIGAEALGWLAGMLGADRGVTLGEVEKLALYCAGAKEVTLEDCRAVVGEVAALELDDAVYAAAGGEAVALDRALTRAFREGVSPITVLRAAQRHLQRLHLVTGDVAGGRPLEAAVKGLRPPVFFKQADRFRRQARSWTPARLASALDLLTEAELRAKTTGQPDRLICQRVLMQIAVAARRG
ncbi:MAG: DNA polymerase III subunit delta [Alphaproteobacteria bacterium]|nr:DNA polymerase III subunit delta [Alphaproteobacteria bacterium]